MDAFWQTLVGGVLAIAGAALPQWLIQSYQSQNARADRRQAVLARRQEYLLGLMERLIEASSLYQTWLGETGEFKNAEEYRKSPLGEQAHAKIIQAAIAAWIASGNSQLREIGLNKGGAGLVPYETEGFASQNRDAILKAIDLMADLINKTTVLEDSANVASAD